MGIRDRPTAARSPWQNGYCGRAIGSIRRECLDHVVVFSERHLRHLLRSYTTYYNAARTHLSLNKDAPAANRTSRWSHFCLRHFLADFIICMCEFDFRQAQPVETTSSRETFELGVWSVIRLCLHPPSHRARRPSPERYVDRAGVSDRFAGTRPDAGDRRGCRSLGLGLGGRRC